MKSGPPQIREAAFPADCDGVRELFKEYADSLAIDLCFQGFAHELATLPGKYAPPAGRLLLARTGTALAGCVALRPLDQGACEVKRLYVRPGFRRMGCGRALAQAIIQAAREIGYERMRLDTLSSMTPALELYRNLGFRPIPPYYANPSASAVFLEMGLDQKTGAPPGSRDYPPGA
jgi:ribosomal protein S18 acetylase RimI-like enzyme